MKFSFRWYGPSDPIPLGYIRQIPNMTGIVSAIYSVPVGELWPEKDIQSLKSDVEAHGMHFEVVESVPVHEDIKLGKATRSKYIENYKENIRRLAQVGVKTICYNFMPVFDWTRTDLNFINEDSSSSLALDLKEITSLDPLTEDFSLPGWDESYSKHELKALFEAYQSVTEDDLWENLGYFLNEIIPVAEEVGINMAIHPDDPPYPIFGLPRIITDNAAFQRLFELNPSSANGVTFCTGSLGARNDNDIYAMLEDYLKKGKVHFMHTRNILLHADNSFEETAHMSKYGSVDMVKVFSLLKQYHYNGYVRPDHGRMIWGENGRPGYGLYDRALGASYLNGIWEALHY
ncbi:mannonate dehydratase [Candidatus Enterococcus clewellii]|uniref:Mannonate dehydratase n=1 Tax=Candidatus Enterococcus clewellii TaxID=1834193 RepID=A0A242K6W0_9ENTE|nr:mannonate dehydratase [Enterococcus sp. 9E7_DIV0242]OTP15956.1 mannonate dehydratase [Enterococcus sp. 9E7_DIV0242]